MKALIAISLLISSLSFASTVEGPKARAVYDALKANGVKISKHVEVSYLKVANVSCTMDEKGSECSLRDLVAKKTLKVRDSKKNNKSVTALFNALNEAGAEMLSRPEFYSLDAKSVSCHTFYHAGPHINCEVEVK